MKKKKNKLYTLFEFNIFNSSVNPIQSSSSQTNTLMNL